MKAKYIFGNPLLSIICLLLFWGGLAHADTISGWETESALVNGNWSHIQYYAIPYLAYDDPGYNSHIKNGYHIIISGRSSYGGYFGYYWDNGLQEWIYDTSLVEGLEAHGYYEAPALAYNLMGDDKWILIGHEWQNSAFYGYYWNGAEWIEDSLIVSGLPSFAGRTSHTFIDNLTGDNTWTLISGTEDGTFAAFYWDGFQWIEDASRVNGLEDIGMHARVTSGFNLFGNNKWNVIATDYLTGTFKCYWWNGTDWNEDTDMIKLLV